MIEVQALTRRYGFFTAVDHLSFNVTAGEVLGFLGPNGAGKSTSMKMLTGFLAPSSGTAIINGHDIRSERIAVQRLIGYLPEGAPLYGEMTVTQMLKFAGQIRGMNGAECQRAVDQAIERLNLQKVRHQPTDTLSKGFKRRVGLALAILHNPKVLVMDEPTDGLDPNQKHEVRNLIQEMAADRTIIVSTHILEEVEAVCSRAIIIAGGKLVADDTPAGLIRRSRFHNAVSLSVAEDSGLDARQVASILSELPEAANVEVNGVEVTVFPDGDVDLLSAVNNKRDEHHWQVKSMRLEAGRMDEVFRQITLGSGQAAPTGASQQNNNKQEAA
ncbi:MAG: ABC transporter ATP-binding protein [Xanthomonadales bacterium]|nr:ABC transporter ATP-binding protein [Xanthomonadales bacterium]